ncbi:RHS repeat-associated core domain-containing protein [Motiliproteus sp. MSK22-1]|uniref:RHS repeat-associated core domain-containing protein n=1 Tax=Motiliproteus sp. MSK22-1 TaxID=1897630 RepID=UPI000978BDE7|nr:RHS repeat-associated core domain-containing protein [Motiliproteus sp. MSK22-1]OMH25755.1 hypothetical protein BGP75_24825 [Motiliproteus sp. MSK22-1]
MSNSVSKPDQKSKNEPKNALFEELQAWMDAGEPEYINNTGSSSRERSTLLTAGHRVHPLASKTPGMLGSRMEGNVILQTGQLYYEESLITLAGNMPIQLKLHYLSEDPYSGHLGPHWRFHYESRFSQYATLAQQPYRLSLSNGQRFDFHYDAQTHSLVDDSQQGIEISWDHKVFKVSYPDGHTAFYQDGHLQAEKDRNGNYIRLNYNDQQQLIGVQNSSGSSLSLRYNHEGQIEAVSDHGERAWLFKYGSTGLLKEVVLPSGGKRLYQYKTDDSQTSSHSQSNNQVTQSTGLLKSVHNSLNQALLEVLYHDNGQVSSVSEKLTEKLVSKNYRYDLDKSSIIVNIQEEPKTYYHWDSYGLIDRIRFANGFTQYLQWQAADKTAIKGDCRGLTGTFRYDHRLRLLEKTDLKNTTLYSYIDQQVNAYKIETSQGNIIQSHDSRGNLLSLTNAQGLKENFQYDTRGNCTQTIDANGQITQTIFNNMDQPIAKVGAEGNRITAQYDCLGRVQQISDQEQRTVRFTYNSDDSIAEISDDSGRIFVNYDVEGQLSSISDPSGYKTHYHYDSQGRVLEVKSTNGKLKAYDYDNDGNLVQIRREDNSTVHYDYQTDSYIERVGELETHYHFDSVGRLIHARCGESSLKFSYDRSGSIVQEQQNEHIIGYSYANGKRIHLNYFEQQVNYQRDDIGQLTGIRLNDKIFITQQHNTAGQLTVRDYPNHQREQRSYDTAGELTDITTGSHTLKYVRDKSGLIKQKNDHHYQYDTSGRLICSGKTHYKYDSMGNLTQLRLNDQSNISQEEIWHYQPGSNQLLENPTHRFSYDQRGNLIKKTSKVSGDEQHYKYNAKNQLVRFHGQRYDAIKQRWIKFEISYRYDPLGRRIEKLIGRTRYEYIYDRLNIIAILIHKASEKPHLVSITHDDKTDTPLCISSHNGTFYYHRDHQGSIIALTNEAGEIVEKLDYDNSYGVLHGYSKQIETYNPYGFTGRETDASDLYYYRARYYDPTIQRFISRDPIGFESGDCNFYRYVENNPNNLIDPLGFKSANCSDKAKKNRKDKYTKVKNRLFDTRRVAKNLALKSAAKKGAALAAALADGPLPIGEVIAAGILVWDAWEIYSVASDLETMIEEMDDILDEMIECKENEDRKNADNGGAVKGSKNREKCAPLQGEEQKCRPGEYRGGRHGTIYKGGNACNRDSHHIPGKASYPGRKNRRNINGGISNDDNLPAIQMDRSDHKGTISNGSGKTAKIYRNIQNKLIRAGMFGEAFALDVFDIRIQNGDKYDTAIAEAAAWAKCMGYL